MKPEVGFRVIRGCDWAYLNQDGGLGHVGTVISLRDYRHPAWPHGTVLVQWDNGNRGLYRAGHERAFDLRVTDTSPTGMHHCRVWCDGCDREEIWGIRWWCTQCFAFDLCTDCYMGGKHDLDHVFMRVPSSVRSSMGPRMLPRNVSSHVTVKGVFNGASVVRFPSWFQRRSGSLSGVIVPDKESDDRQPCSSAREIIRHGKVSADFGRNVTTMLAIGRDGCVEVACTRPASTGEFYIGHLPQLGDTEPVGVGDRVVVAASQAEFAVLQRRHGLRDVSMGCDRKNGVACERTDLGDLIVDFEDTEESCTINPSALVKRHLFRTGQNVRVITDLEMVKRMQSGHGGWTLEMKKIVGKPGQVIEVYGDDVRVRVDEGKAYTLNGAILLPEKPPGNATRVRQKRHRESFDFGELMYHPLIAAVTTDDAEEVGKILTQHPNLVNWTPVPGKPIICYVAENCGLPTLRNFVENGAPLESLDSGGLTPIMNAIVENRFENIKYLLESGADVNYDGGVGLTPLFMACNKVNPHSVSLLLQHGADVNEKGERGDPPLIEIVANFDMESLTLLDMMLERTDTDLKTVENLTERTAILQSMRPKKVLAVKKILEKAPRLAGVRGGDDYTPLMGAAHYGSAEIADTLLKTNYTDVNAQEPTEGYTALHLAAVDCHYDVIDLLLKHGADLNITNKRGTSVLECFLTKYVFLSTPAHRILDEMKRKWRHVGIHSNLEAFLAYFVDHGAELHLDIATKIQMLASRNTFSALQEIQRRRRQTLANKDSRPTPVRDAEQAGRRSKKRKNKKGAKVDGTSRRSEPRAASASARSEEIDPFLLTLMAAMSTHAPPQASSPDMPEFTTPRGRSSSDPLRQFRGAANDVGPQI